MPLLRHNERAGVPQHKCQNFNNFLFIRKISVGITERERKPCLNSVDLQLLDFSWSNDITQYAIELVVFMDDGYNEHNYEVYYFILYSNNQ